MQIVSLKAQYLAHISCLMNVSQNNAILRGRIKGNIHTPRWWLGLLLRESGGSPPCPLWASSLYVDAVSAKSEILAFTGSISGLFFLGKMFLALVGGW